MTRRTASVLTGWVALLALVLGGGVAVAGDAPAETIEHQATWDVTAAGKPVGTEALKAVVSPSKTRFATVEVKPAGKGGTKLVSHLQRDPEGKLQKYRRVEDKRKGEGVFAFLKGDGLRIVGINSSRKAAELAGTTQHAVWDGRVWATLWHWTRRLEGAQGAVTIAYLDVDKGTTGQATATRGEARQARNAKGESVPVTVWNVTGVGGAELTMWVGPKGKLVGARRGDREMMLQGWGWDVPGATPPTGVVDGDGKGPTPEAGAEEGAAGEKAVGP